MTFVYHFFKERKLSHLFFSIGLATYSWAVASFIPSMKESTKLYLEILKAYPKELITFLSGTSFDPKLFTVEGYLVLEIFGLWLPVIIYIYAISFASSIISKDVETGTIENILSQPVSRSRVVLERALALLAGILFLTFVALLTLYLFCEAYGVSLKIKGVTFIGIHMFAFIAFLAMLHLLLTSIFLERGLPIAISVTFFIASHLLNSFAYTSDFLKDIRFISVFKYYKPIEAFVDLKFPVAETLGFAAGAAGFLILSVLIFKKKDISIA